MKWERWNFDGFAPQKHIHESDLKRYGKISYRCIQWQRKLDLFLQNPAEASTAIE